MTKAKPDKSLSEKRLFVGRSMPAMQRAAEVARAVAIETGTGIAIVRDNQVVRVSADELRKQAELRR